MDKETLDRCSTRVYMLRLILERAQLRAEVQQLRQAMKETVRHE